MSAGTPLPKARVGDVVVGDVHPNPGFVMFRVARAYMSKEHHWIYVSDDGITELNEMWLEHVYKDKNIR